MALIMRTTINLKMARQNISPFLLRIIFL